MAKNDYFYTLGRRKSSTARVRMTPGKGTTTINEKPAEEYFAESTYLLGKLNEPFTVLEIDNKYDVSVRVSGGGHVSQVEAIRLGIAKILSTVDENLKGTLKRADLLSRDPRDKERKKFGFKGARKKRQFTKR
jgi:small subunit ribosomal protein S9